MIVITSSLVLNPVETGPDHPLIGWNNLVTAANIAADSSAANYPASNLANPATYREWRANTAVECHLTVTTDGVTPIDYVALAKHNLGSALIAVSVEGFISGGWTELCSPVILPDDTPSLWRFSPQALPQIRWRFQASSISVIPRAAVAYVGKLLVMEKRIYVGHTPFPHARKDTFSNGVSESGQFLGRIQLGSTRETTAPFRLLSPAWYRANMDAFLANGKGAPFFFAWRPATYPREVGYGWLLNDPMQAPQDSSDGNLIAIELQMGGIA